MEIDLDLYKGLIVDLSIQWIIQKPKGMYFEIRIWCFF